jgi:HD superfamily phosphohydrolase/serine/threonine protein kinase
MSTSGSKTSDLNEVVTALLGTTAGGQHLDEKRGRLKAKLSGSPLPGVVNLGELKLAQGALVAVGGSGVVVQCVNAKAPAVKYALKVVRPSLFQNRTDLAHAENKKLLEEFENHAPLAHPNIAKVLQTGRVTSGSTVLNALLMEWIPEAKPLLKYCMGQVVESSQFFELVVHCFSALDHLHKRGLIHWDVKSANMLVDEYGTVKLTDVGNARKVGNPTAHLLAYSTEGNFPPALEQYRAAPDGDDESEQEEVSANRVPLRLPDASWDAPWLDMWMLARELNRMVAADAGLYQSDIGQLGATWDDQAVAWRARVFPPESDEGRYSLAFVTLILQRLLRPKDPQAARYYRSAEEVVHDLQKLAPEFGAAQSIEELRAVPQRVLRIPRSGNVPWTRRLHATFNSPLLQRLTLHTQLGAVAQVYPGGVHRRFEHAIGVASSALLYVRALFSDRTDPFWRISIEAHDVEALLFAAAIHDAGHIAFGHYLEEMRGLFSGRTHEDYVVQLLNPKHVALPGEERRFGKVASERLEDDRADLLALVRGRWCADDDESACEFLAKVAEILRPSREGSPLFDPDAICDREAAEQLKMEVLHSILDGPIDADKLDYLLRDAWHSGIQYPFGIDEDRFFQALTTIHHIPSPSVLARRGAKDYVRLEPVLRACVGVTRKGLLPLESLLIGRYQMFSSVYWQHTARAETALLQYVIQEYLGRSPASRLQADLEELIGVFFTRNDSAALEWLRDCVSAAPLPDRHKALAQSACNALLGDRQALWWSGFEMRYEKADSKSQQSLYNKLALYAAGLNQAPTLKRYLERQAALRQTLAQQLSRRLGVRLSPGDALVDIPEPNADQVKNVFVHDDRALAAPIKPIQELSPIADAVSETFRFWARKIRVFLSPGAWEEITDSKLGPKDVSEALREVLEHIADDQYRLEKI